ncbi:hypothetical protein J6590_015983 [Homalodisca vitripennis]|nr:hypothetical protein J6590_015983 [Homalodisca vitripennis]
MKEHPGVRQMSQEEMAVVLRWLEGWKNDSADLRAPQVKASMTGLYPGLVVLYSLVLVGAAVLNGALIYTVLRHRLYNLGLLLSLAISNLLLSCFVLPPTVAVLILHNWLLGRVLCHLLPLVQVSVYFILQ